MIAIDCFTVARRESLGIVMEGVPTGEHKGIYIVVRLGRYVGRGNSFPVWAHFRILPVIL